MVESLTSKVKAWELERKIPFLHDIAPLLHTLEEYTVLRREREEEKRRSREQKRLQEQFAADQEALYGSRSAIKRSPWVRAPVPIQYGDGLFFGYGG
uniref:Uncharacterized protein n=1 Tax=Populus trichocarpa TaxID=3694 RepID=A0A2K1X271_POPTR